MAYKDVSKYYLLFHNRKRWRVKNMGGGWHTVIRHRRANPVPFGSYWWITSSPGSHLSDTYVFIRRRKTWNLKYITSRGQASDIRRKRNG